MSYQFEEALGATTRAQFDAEREARKAKIQAAEAAAAPKKKSRWSKFTDALTSGAGGAWDVVSAMERQKGAASAQQPGYQAAVVQSDFTKYLPYLAVGGGVIALILITRKKK